MQGSFQKLINKVDSQFPHPIPVWTQGHWHLHLNKASILRALMLDPGAPSLSTQSTPLHLLLRMSRHAAFWVLQIKPRSSLSSSQHTLCPPTPEAPIHLSIYVLHCEWSVVCPQKSRNGLAEGEENFNFSNSSFPWCQKLCVSRRAPGQQRPTGFAGGMKGNTSCTSWAPCSSMT